MSMFRTDSVELDSGEVFRVKELSAKQRAEMLECKDALERQCLAVAAGVIGDDGAAKYSSPADIADWPARVVDQISMKVLELSGLTGKKTNSHESEDSSSD